MELDTEQRILRRIVMREDLAVMLTEMTYYRDHRESLAFPGRPFWKLDEPEGRLEIT